MTDNTQSAARWYMVTHDGVATLCEDLRDAEKEAKDADMAWPHSGPHRAVQLVEASTAGFTAADMATAAAQGFRDGVASVAANAGSEPIAWLVCTEEGDPSMVFLDQREAQMFLEDDERPTPLYSHSSPPEGMAGWKLVPIEPTLDMGWAYLDAARESEPLRTHSFNHAGYRAMIAAAPPLPASEAKEPI